MTTQATLHSQIVCDEITHIHSRSLFHTHLCCSFTLILVALEILAAGQVHLRLPTVTLVKIMPTCVHWRMPLIRSFSTPSMKSLRQPAFNRNRLPNLSEVLNELTLEPVDLRSFLEFMQNQQKSSDYLDFLYVFP